MAEGVIQQFDLFIERIDKQIIKFIKDKDNKLTKHISEIQWRLWKRYKEINGTSAGFHGISEYIVFSTFKKFIEELNKQEFQAQPINRDLRYFELTRNNNILRIYRSASLRRYPVHLELNRAPDIAILKEEEDNFNFVAVIEIKNYLDKGSTNSALDILSQVQEAVNDDRTKYAIISFGRVSVRHEETQEKLGEFQNKENNFLITNEGGNEELGLDFLRPRENKWEGVVDLSEFLNTMKDKVML